MMSKDFEQKEQENLLEKNSEVDMRKNSNQIKYTELRLDEKNPAGFPYTYYATDFWALSADRTREKTWLFLTDNWRSKSTDEDAGLDILPYTKVACTKDITAHFATYRGGIRGMEFDDFKKIASYVEKTPELMAKENNVEIISVEECGDEAYGASLVQYSLGENHVSFAFCDVDVSGKDYDLNVIREEVFAQIEDKARQPLWSELSKTLLDEILDSPFDMHFVEYSDDDWTDEKADEIWEEADKHSLCVTRGEDDDYLTFYAGVMNEINWSGHPYYGTPCLEDVIIAQDKIEELKKQEGVFEYVDSYGDTNYVRFTMDMYNENDNLYLGLESYDPEFDCFMPYGGITVNVSPLPYLHSTVDTNNNSSAMISFLIKNGIGEPTGDYLPSGRCNFPVFKFSEEKLMELCPKEFSQYRQTHGMAPSLETRISEGVMKQGTKGNVEKTIHTSKNDKEKESGRD